VSAVLNSEETIPSTNDKTTSAEIREGDWKAYLHFSAKGRANPAVIERYGSAAAYQRACALAYLGRRAQLHGGVCSTRHPHIITSQFIADLEATNKAQRYSRYPWLEALMNILAEIERIQDEISVSTNVISLIPVAK
jgi:hypothetical protein